MNRNDRRIAYAALCVLFLATLLLFLGIGDDYTSVPQSVDGMADSLKRTASETLGRQHVSYETAPRHMEEFPFDPNTADSTQLLRLGLQPWQVRNIYRYRSRGGVYRQKEDFARLYGLTVKDYRRLEPYIRISDDYRPASTLVGHRQQEQRDTVRYPVKLNEGERLVLNTADTTQLKKVPGIGSYFAREIVRYGQRLGGYVSIDQLDEIDGFPQDAKPYLVIRQSAPEKLNVNKLTLQQLRRHPYINYYQAKAIVDYRRLYGPITSLNQLSLLQDFPQEAIQRLAPYITY